MRTLSVLSLFLFASFCSAHCQIPCGIYGDDARFTAMLEDAATLRKSITQIETLSKEKTPNHNQLARWIANKDAHAQKIQQTVLDYFLAQRIKEGQPHYDQKLAHLHKIIVLAMKAKQTTDVAHVDALEAEIKAFQTLYRHKH